MLGTWHPTRVERSLTESSPAASDSRTHRRLGSASARPTAAKRSRSVSLEIVADVGIADIAVTPCASTQVQRTRSERGPGAAGAPGASAILRADARPHRQPRRDPRRPRAIVARMSIGRRCSRRPPPPGCSRSPAALRSPTARIHVKAEHLQVTGSFKPRGMTNKVASLTPEQRARGIVTLSAGNAAQAYAWAGRAAGVHATVVMPAKAVRSKVDACLGYGAEVVLHGAHVGETLQRVKELEAERGLVYCHPFDDPGGDRRPRQCRAGDPRRSARRRRRRHRGRRRRAQQWDRGSRQGAAPGRPGVRRRARRSERGVARPRPRRGRPDPADHGRGRAGGPVRRRLDAGDAPALPRRPRPARRRRRSWPASASPPSG